MKEEEAQSQDPSRGRSQDRSPKRLALWGGGAILAIFLLLWAIGAATGRGMPGAGGKGRADRILLLRVEGPIGGPSGGLFGGVSTSAEALMDDLRRAADDPRVAALVLRLNTPGGSAAASQEIGVEIRRFREETGRPVVASMGDVAASGGYWLAALADEIVANPATTTGSIGVIMQLSNYEGLYEMLGVEVETVKSGPHKDMGSPTRSVSPVERRLFQAMIDDIYQQFVDVVTEGRDLPRERVLELADGRIFTGRQALDLGLVDRLGNLRDAERRAAELAGLDEDEYEVIEYRPDRLLDQLLDDIGARLGSGLARGLAGALLGGAGPSGSAAPVEPAGFAAPAAR